VPDALAALLKPALQRKAAMKSSGLFRSNAAPSFDAIALIHA
jgi:hypothetical protein